MSLPQLNEFSWIFNSFCIYFLFMILMFTILFYRNSFYKCFKSNYLFFFKFF